MKFVMGTVYVFMGFLASTVFVAGAQATTNLDLPDDVYILFQNYQSYNQTDLKLIKITSSQRNVTTLYSGTWPYPIRHGAMMGHSLWQKPDFLGVDDHSNVFHIQQGQITDLKLKARTLCEASSHSILMASDGGELSLWESNQGRQTRMYSLNIDIDPVTYGLIERIQMISSQQFVAVTHKGILRFSAAPTGALLSVNIIKFLPWAQILASNPQVKMAAGFTVSRAADLVAETQLGGPLKVWAFVDGYAAGKLPHQDTAHALFLKIPNVTSAAQASLENMVSLSSVNTMNSLELQPLQVFGNTFLARDESDLVSLQNGRLVLERTAAFSERTFNAWGMTYNAPTARIAHINYPAVDWLGRKGLRPGSPRPTHITAPTLPPAPPNVSDPRTMADFEALFKKDLPTLAEKPTAEVLASWMRSTVANGTLYMYFGKSTAISDDKRRKEFAQQLATMGLRVSAGWLQAIDGKEDTVINRKALFQWLSDTVNAWAQEQCGSAVK